jgi:hypothetical protein
VRVDVCDRRLEARIRIEAVERLARRRQVGIGEMDDFRHEEQSAVQCSPERLNLFMPLLGEAFAEQNGELGLG